MTGFLLSVDLTTHRAMVTALLLTIAALIASALLLPLTRRGRAGNPAGAAPPRRAHPWRTAGRWSARALAMLLPVIMILATGAMAFNRSLKIVTTPRDLFGIIAANLSGPQTGEAQSADGQSDGAQSEHERTQSGDPALLTDFQPTEESGMLKTTWTGPISGITQPVYAITPKGYRPDDGKKYGVIMTLHGYPGDPEGTMWGAQVSEALQSAIDQGLIPPTIVIGPEVNVDDSEHDCADLPGRPPVFTWVTKDVPAMIKANFPNVSTERAAWMIAGFSSGAYCAVWTAMRAPEVFGSAASLSGYNTQIEGGMKSQGQQYLADNTLSTMLANRTPDGLRIYAMAAQDDAVGGAPAAVAMANAVKAPDSVTPDTPETGGHAGPLWREHIPTMLAWWGSDNSVARAVGTPPTAEAAQSSSGFGQIVTAQTVTHRTLPSVISAPANTLPPAFFSSGLDSPVRWLSSAQPLPLSIMPSAAMRSPWLARIRSPICTWSMGSCFHSPSRCTLTWVGVSFSSKPKLFRLDFLVRCSKNLPSDTKPITITPTSKYTCAMPCAACGLKNSI